MTGPDAKPQPVSYSNVAKARQQGYHFADQKHLEQYAHDFNADPKNAHAVDTWLHNQPWWNLPAGAVKAASGVGASVEDLVAGADRLVRKVTGTKLTGPEESLQISAAKPTDGVQAGAGYAGEQVGELIAIPEEIPGKLAEITRLGEGVDALSKIERVKEITQLLDKYPALKTAVGIGLKVVGQGAKAGVEQGGQALVHSGGDVEQTKQAAEFGALGGGAAATAPDLLGAAGQFSKNVLRNRFNIDEAATEKVVKEAQKANEKIATDADKVHADNVEKIRQARDSGNEADAARLEHDNVVQNQQAIEAKRQNLLDARASVRKSIQQRVQAISQAAKDYFKKNFAEVAAKLDAPDPETGEPHTVAYADLDADIEKAEEKIKGKRENVPIFQDIGKKAQGVGEGSGKKMTPLEIAELDPDERETLGASLPGAKYSDLDGYYQEAGRAIGNPATLPDVRQALVEFREALGKRMQDLADEVDPKVGDKHKLLRKQYREYAEGFKDATGPSDSGSATAKSLNAKDPYNATKPYLDLKEPEEVSRNKKMLVGNTSKPETQLTDKQIVGPDGKPQPAWRFRKDTHALIDHARNIEDGLGSLPTSEDLAKQTQKSADKLAESRAAARDAANPKLDEEPPLQVTDPQALRDIKATQLHQTAHNLSKFGTWMAVMGPVSAIATFLKTGDVKKSAEIGVGALAGGLVTPYLLSKLLDNPAVVRSLASVSRKDLQQLAALPADQRAGVEQAIKQLADEAVRKGKLKTEKIPWFRILGGEAAKAATKPAPKSDNQGESEEDIQRDLNAMQGATQ
jgi:hypothetical protein